MLIPTAYAQEQQLTICSGNYALCAASTCKLTGKTIKTNDGKTYPEVVCTCPVLNGKSIADTSAGVMKGSCNVDDPDKHTAFAPASCYTLLDDRISS